MVKTISADDSAWSNENSKAFPITFFSVVNSLKIVSIASFSSSDSILFPKWYFLALLSLELVFSPPLIRINLLEYLYFELASKLNYYRF